MTARHRPVRDPSPIVESGRLRPPALVVHGGAGRRTPGEVPEARRRAFRDAVSAALDTGWGLLSAGADAVSVAVEVVSVLEDSGVLNAGRGSVHTSAGTVEMDAAVMEGATRAAGSVACVRGVRNPVRAARAVLAGGRWVMLAGPDADRFAMAAGCGPAPPDWFTTPALAGAPDAPMPDVPVPDAPMRDAPVPDVRVPEVRVPEVDAPGVPRPDAPASPDDPVHDTVGAVVVDARHRTAAATSTGGMPGQVPGRVGDSPVIGAGVWADDRSCAVSGTGTGEMFLRAAAAHHVHLRVLLAGSGGDRAGLLTGACRAALDEVAGLGGYGGLIALTPAGHHALVATTTLLIRGWAGAGTSPVVRLFPDGP